MNLNGHEAGSGGYGQEDTWGNSPFFDPIIIKEWTSLDEHPVNRADKEAKIFRAQAPSLKGAPWFGTPYTAGTSSSSSANFLEPYLHRWYH